MTIREASQQEIDFLEERLLQHNLEQVATNLKEDERRFSYVIKEGEQILAGVVAYSVAWKILYVDTLWVAPDHRRQGLASLLLARLFTEAREYGCQLVYLSTFDFQGLDFYLQQDFTLFGTLEDSPKGHREYFLSKVLV